MKILFKKVTACLSVIPLLCFSVQFAAAATNQETYDRAVALENSGDHAGAAKLMNQLLEADPTNDSYLAYASHVERMAGNFEKGFGYAFAAVKINPNVPWYYVSVALNAYGYGELDIAKEYAKKSIEFGSEKIGKDNHTNVENLLKNISGKTYEITWNLDPAKGIKKNGRYYIPVPTTKLPYQTAKYSVTGVKSLKRKVNGNNVISFKANAGDQLKIVATAKIKAYSFKEKLEKYVDSGEIPASAKPFFGKSEGIDPKSEVILGIVADLKTPDKIETIKNILGWMKKNITYKIEDYKNVEEIIARGYGECGGWSALFVAFARASGIPARVVWGVMEDQTPDRQFAPEGHLKGHAWAEFYLNGIGWVPVEPQDAATLGLLPSTYVRMYHYTATDNRWMTKNFNTSSNMVIMGGDTPEFTYE